jgi:hypothetical protein
VYERVSRHEITLSCFVYRWVEGVHCRRVRSIQAIRLDFRTRPFERRFQILPEPRQLGRALYKISPTPDEGQASHDPRGYFCGARLLLGHHRPLA